MSRTFAHAHQNAPDSRRIRRPRFADTRAAAQREALAIVADALADSNATAGAR